MRARYAKPIDGFDSKTKAAVIEAATNEFEKQKKLFLDSVFDVILWQLHTQCGFGLKRLTRFYREMFITFYRDRERYELVGSSGQREKDRKISYPQYAHDRLKSIGFAAEDIEDELMREYQNGEIQI